MRTFAQKPQANAKATSAKPATFHPAQVQQSHAAHPIQRRQDATGDQAVLQPLEASAVAANREAKSSPAFAGFDFSRISVHPPAPGRLQAKLKLGAPGDVYEQEADRVADQVMRMPEPARPSGGGYLEGRNAQDSHARVLTKRAQAKDASGPAVPPIVHEVLRSPGQPLDPATRSSMEPRFGHDFSQVRVHADAKAAESASSIGARAFTSDRNIVFGAGEYAPQAQSGRRLLSHELAHVVQQGSGARLKVGASEDGKPYERQTNGLADAVGRNQHFPLGTSGIANAETTVQRKNSTETIEDPESTAEPATERQTSAPDGGRAFELVIKDVKYRFVATPDQKKAGRYHLSGGLSSPAGKDQISYSINIDIDTITDNKKIVIMNPLLISMSGMSSDGKKKQLAVPLRALQDALNSNFPIGVGGSDWDFVVLEVYDEDKKTPPWRKVYWMGGKWGGPSPPTPGKRIATFRVERKKVEAKIKKDFSPSLTPHSEEKLTQEEVNKIIENENPERTSDVGFNQGSYVGMMVKSNLVDIDAPGGVSSVPFDEAAGKKAAGTTDVYEVSLSIVAPPVEIQANFQEGASDIPGGLTPDSRAKFNDLVRLVLLYLQDTSGANIKIHAFTDTVGTSEKNKTLSQARAESAKKYMTDATFWTGIGDFPAALAANRITLVEGEGQQLAEENFKKSHPKDWGNLKNEPDKWKKLIGNKAAADPSFRRFEIEYIFR